MPPIPSSQPNVNVPGAAKSFSARFWLLLIVTGLGAGLGASLLLKLLHIVQHLCWAYRTETFLEGVERSPAHRRAIVLVCAGIMAGVGRWLFGLTTGGHGGEVSAAIWFHEGRMPTLRTLGRAVLSILVVGMGASLGREGAAKQTGAAIASRLFQWEKLPPSQCRLLTACGAGAGIAAIYHVPLGGAIFTLEVLLGELAMPLVLPALVASLLATGVASLLVPVEPAFHVPDYFLTPQHVAWAVIAGPLLGLTSVAYVRLIAWADARKPQGWRLVLTPVLALAVLGTTAIVFPQLLGTGKNVVQLAFVDGLAPWLIVALAILKPLATAGCLGSGAPGGLFMPTITFGCLLGGVLGYVWNWFWPVRRRAAMPCSDRQPYWPQRRTALCRQSSCSWN